MDLHDDIYRQLQAGFTEVEIRRELLRRGYTNQDINAAFTAYVQQQSQASFANNPLLQKRWIPVVIMILNCLLFFYIIPGHIIHVHEMLYIFIGAIVMIVCGGWLIYSFRPKIFDTHFIGVCFWGIAVLLLFACALVWRQSGITTDELNTYGLVTNATVVDHNQWSGKRGRTKSSFITVKFRTGDGTYATAEMSVTEHEYAAMPVGYEIPVLYSSKHPAVAVIASERTLDYYKR